MDPRNPENAPSFLEFMHPETPGNCLCLGQIYSIKLLLCLRISSALNNHVSYNLEQYLNTKAN